MRAVVITGAGRGFSAGQDLREFSELQGSLGDALEADLPPEHQAHPRRSRSRSSRPSTGRPRERGSRSRAPATSASRRASAAFVPGFVGIGLVPDSGGTWFLHRLLGFARAFEWMSSNRKLDAEEALAWGLVSEVIPADELRGAGRRDRRDVGRDADAGRRDDEAAVRARDHRLARGAAGARGASCSRPRSATADFAEGVAAFLEKRPPELHRRLSGTGPLRKEP